SDTTTTVVAGPFDATLYLVNNYDIYEAALSLGQDPLAFAESHYNSFGQGEGRSYANALPADFDVEGYLAINGDIAAAAVSNKHDPKIFAMHHYLTSGKGEGRAYKA
ncbi:MAG: hypothetical protein ACK5TR_04530, partial [Alphaproteobacteria bacterium]